MSGLKQNCFILLFVNSLYQSVAVVQQQNIEKGKKISEIFPFSTSFPFSLNILHFLHFFFFLSTICSGFVIINLWIDMQLHLHSFNWIVCGSLIKRKVDGRLQVYKATVKYLKQLALLRAQEYLCDSQTVG